MYEGFFRIATATPSVSVANPLKNARSISELAVKLNEEETELAVFPEMCVTAYTCGDLFHNRKITDEAEEALRLLLEQSMALETVIIVGMPVVDNGTMFNCAVAIQRGRILAIVPKTYVPNYNEFYEKRWWQSGAGIGTHDTELCGQTAPFGTRQLLDIGGVKVGIEICEDMWTPLSPGTLAALAGAEVVVNLSASDALIGKYSYISDLVRMTSARNICAYAYASAGYGESSTDLVFDGIGMIAENGTMLGRTERWQSEAQTLIADADIDSIRRDRMHLTSFSDNARATATGAPYSIVKAEPRERTATRPRHYIDPHPFVPSTDSRLNERCTEIVNIQAAGLAKRLDATHTKNLTVGISGGLDSTLALLVAVKAFDRLGLDRKGILGVTMPGFGTTGRTHGNAHRLMELLGVTAKEISIVPAVEQHFKDIGHDPDNHDVTYENAQARQRTYLLMDLANQTGGMVLGTGDLSELALGWATYNGDHMSMYGVNAGVPKTLVSHLVRWFAQEDESIREVLLDIASTPISPELIPANPDGTIQQKTEDLVGPYELHDFFLYRTLRFGEAPSRIFYLAQAAFRSDEVKNDAEDGRNGMYAAATIRKWLDVFMRRFYRQQFKRSCMPDGPKVGSVCLSPRGDWRMPSDADVNFEF